MFDGGRFLITGGTGSFGRAMADVLVKEKHVDEIIIFSRDEKKQDDMRRRYRDKRLTFAVGDVRDRGSIEQAVKKVDYVFHAAALKQVPTCEFYPMEAVKTNVLGTENVLDAAIYAGVQRVVCLSTDKAVYPINAMGVSKAMMERVAVAKARTSSKTTICITRYGNVLASRGSVIPRFYSQVKAGLPLTITDKKMTRFIMTLREAVNLVLTAFAEGASGDKLVPKTPAISIEVMANALLKALNIPDHPLQIIGPRHGEKLHEVLLAREERSAAKDLGSYYCVPPDFRDLNYENYFDQGCMELSTGEVFDSCSARQLSLTEMVSLLEQELSINKEGFGYGI